MDNPMIAAKFFTTGSGVQIDLANWNEADLRIGDIAHALSNICRFGGHSKRHYSVAEHSMLVAELVPKELKLSALLHDAGEAYLGDVIRPLKIMDGMQGYRDMEAWLEHMINQRYGVDIHHPLIKEADIRALYLEARTFYGAEAIRSWGFREDIVAWGESTRRIIVPYAPSFAHTKQAFLSRFEAYGGRE